MPKQVFSFSGCDFVDFVCKKFDEVKGLFLQKNRQYSTATDPMANFRTGALLRYHSDEPEFMYEAAKDYLGKHIAQVYNNGALGDKVDESLLDIANYAIIMLYLRKMAHEQANMLQVFVPVDDDTVEVVKCSNQ